VLKAAFHDLGQYQGKALLVPREIGRKRNSSLRHSWVAWFKNILKAGRITASSEGIFDAAPKQISSRSSSTTYVCFSVRLYYIKYVFALRSNRGGLINTKGGLIN